MNPVYICICIGTCIYIVILRSSRYIQIFCLIVSSGPGRGRSHTFASRHCCDDRLSSVIVPVAPPLYGDGDNLVSRTRSRCATMVDFISYPEISYLYDEFTTVRTLFLSFLPPRPRFNRVETWQRSLSDPPNRAFAFHFITDIDVYIHMRVMLDY